MDNMFSEIINGFRIISSHYIPAWKWTGPVMLRQTVNVSDKFREEFNQWSLELFGGKKETNILMTYDPPTIYANPIVISELNTLKRNQNDCKKGNWKA